MCQTEFESLLDSKLKHFTGKLKDVVGQAVKEKVEENENRQTNSNLNSNISFAEIVNKNHKK